MGSVWSARGKTACVVVEGVGQSESIGGRCGWVRLAPSSARILGDEVGCGGRNGFDARRFVGKERKRVAPYPSIRLRYLRGAGHTSRSCLDSGRRDLTSRGWRMTLGKERVVRGRTSSTQPGGAGRLWGRVPAGVSVWTVNGQR